MNLLIWLVAGGSLGWLASDLMRPYHQQEIVLNVMVGIIGALVAGFATIPVPDAATISASNFSVAGLLASSLGAAVLLTVVNFYQDPTVRPG